MKQSIPPLAVLVTVLTLFHSSWAAAPVTLTEPLQQYRWASQVARNNRWDSAEKEFESFIKRFPHHPLVPSALFAIAEIHLKQNNVPSAAQKFGTIAKKYRGTYEGWNAALRLAQCEFNLGKYLNAIDKFQDVQQKAPRVLRSEALFGEALCWMNLKDVDKADKKLTELLQSYPAYKTEPRAVIPLGILMIQKNKLQQAKELLGTLSESNSARYYKGVALRLLGETVSASQIFKDVFQDNPRGPLADKAQLQLGESYYQSEEWKLALDAYKRVYSDFKSSPLRSYALYRMASVDFLLGRYEEASVKWQELLKTFETDEKRSSAIFMLGEMALRQNDDANALTYFSQISDKSDLRMDSRYKMLWSLVRQGQAEKAVSEADAFIKDYPWGDLCAKALLLKGLALHQLKQYSESNAAYQRVLDQFSKTPYAEKAVYLMAVSLYQNGKLAEIVTTLNATLKDMPVTPSRWQGDTYAILGEAYYSLGQYADAERVFQLVVDNYKDAPMLTSSLLGAAAALAQTGETEKAAAAQEKAMALAVQTANKNVQRGALLDSAELLFSQKKYEKALGQFDEYIQKYPDEANIPDALHQSGICLYRLEYYTEALKRWDRVATHYPSHELAPRSLYEMGRTQFGLANYDQAALAFQKLIDKYPADPTVKDAHIQIAQCYYNQGRFDDAARQLQAFVDANPQDPKVKDVLELLQMAHYRKGTSPDQIAALTEKFPDGKLTADIYWRQGAEAFNNKDYTLAYDSFRKFVSAYPQSPNVAQAYFYMAESQFLSEDYKGAIPSYRNFIRNFPADPNYFPALFRMGVSSFQLEQYRDAAATFNEVADSGAPEGMVRDALLNIPIAYKKSGQNGPAFNAYQRFIDRFPKDEQRDELLIQMGQLQEEMKNTDAALEIYEQIPPSSPMRADALVASAKIYRILKQPQKEIDTYERLRKEVAPSNEVRLGGLVTLAEMYQDAGKKADAVAVYNDIAAHATNPDWRRVAAERAAALANK